MKENNKGIEQRGFLRNNVSNATDVQPSSTQRIRMKENNKGYLDLYFTLWK